jgi:hypothetical protein
VREYHTMDIVSLNWLEVSNCSLESLDLLKRDTTNVVMVVWTVVVSCGCSVSEPQIVSDLLIAITAVHNGVYWNVIERVSSHWWWCHIRHRQLCIRVNIPYYVSRILQVSHIIFRSNSECSHYPSSTHRFHDLVPLALEVVIAPIPLRSIHCVAKYN